MARLDIVIFGATGFTGKHVVEEAVKIAKEKNITFGIAGRSRKKLEDILEAVHKKTGKDTSNIEIIIADIDDEKSINEMCSRAKVVANCCGPYRHYGEPVIKACIANKAHHVDISGEPQFIETMSMKYDKEARANGVYVISACGFDSIPNDMGVVYLQQHFDGVVNSVESFMSSSIPSKYIWSSIMHGTLNYGTWESLVHSLANWNELKRLREALHSKKMPELNPKLKARSIFEKHANSYCLPFPGADRSIVYRTQQAMYENENQRPAQFRPYVEFKSIFSMLAMLFAAGFVYVFSQINLTKNWLLNYPRLFSLGLATREGPRLEVTENTHFEFEITGKGWDKDADLQGEPNKELSVKVKGTNPGYGATAIGILWSAITILHEQDKMPKECGVLTTGFAFKNTNLVQHLNDNHFTFELVKQE